MPSAAADLALLEAAAREAGAIARDGFGQKVETWSKGHDGSPVTEIDLALDKLLTERLRSARPDYGWLSEETTDNTDRLSHERIFIVDPLDGTRAFIAGTPDFVVALAVVEGDEAVLGCVYNPILDEMYVGGRDVPATLNGAPIHPTAREDISGSRLIGRANFFQNPNWPVPWPKDIDFDFKNSIAYRMSLIAAGVFDGAVMLGFKNEWDTAAGTAILKAASGRVTDMYGAQLLFNQSDPRAACAVASGGPLHPALMERIKHLQHPQVYEDMAVAAREKAAREKAAREGKQ